MLYLIEKILWEYIGIFIILFVSIFLTFKSKFFQLKTLCNPKLLQKNIQEEHCSNTGIHPFKLFFASTAGMIGLGNITNISDSIIKGGPGVIFWMIIASILGMIIKYSEIYLGVKYRNYNQETKEYYGGPMNFIFKAFSSKILVWLFVIFFLIYSIEIYQFNVLIEQMERFSNYSKIYWTILMLIIIFFTGFRHTLFLVNICTYIMPILFLCYFLFFIFILTQYYFMIPSLLYDMVFYAFNPYSAIQGFAGASVILTIHQAMTGTIYSGDIGIGYDSTIQSKTSIKNAATQGKFAIWALLADTLICLQTVIIVYLTSYWKHDNINSNNMIANIIADHMNYGEIFYTLLVFISSFTTIISFINVGRSISFQISGYKFQMIYQIIVIFFLLLSSFYTSSLARLIMSISGGMLILINILSIFKLRHEIQLK